MSFVPQEELQANQTQSLAPMIDFLFLMLMFFATLAVSRVTTRETEIDLVEIRPETHKEVAHAETDRKTVHVTVDKEGRYQWVTDLQDHQLTSPEAVVRELFAQQKHGLLPNESDRTEVLLRVDKEAQWEPVLRLIFAVRDAGFAVHPLYIPEEVSDLAGS
jgi:biopolymer transport protein ExbD